MNQTVYRLGLLTLLLGGFVSLGAATAGGGVGLLLLALGYLFGLIGVLQPDSSGLADSE
ncbi:hypothetical protein [Halolamina salina]|uniref:Uncharacterized protein n=1 Tax=Halolamina salina TaxID=1220023 RepID=A0ABD6B4L6_9EURY